MIKRCLNAIDTRVNGRTLLAAALIAIGVNTFGSTQSLIPVLRLQFVSQADAGSVAISASRWERYTNTRYGVMIDYPADLFTAEPPPPDNAGRNFEAPRVRARFHIYSHANALDVSLDELQAEDMLAIGDAAARKQSGNDWYQITGIIEENTVLRRVLLSDGGATVHRFELAYPTSAAKAFEPIIARMTKSFNVDPTIPEKAEKNAGSAATPIVNPATASAPAWQRFDSLAVGLHVPNYRGNAGVSAEVPANWIRSEMPEPNVIEFSGPQATGEDELHVVFRVERRRPGTTLASEAKILKTRLAEGADNYRLLQERKSKVALRPALLLSQRFQGSDGADLREDVAIIDGGEIIYFVQFGATQARYAASNHIFVHVIATIGFAQ